MSKSKKGRGYLGPGARKEKTRQRTYAKRNSTNEGRYVELHAASAFSFLDGASPPEDLVQEAAARGLPAMALADRNGVYGAPRFHKAAKEAGIRALVGAEVVLKDENDEIFLAGKKRKPTRLEASRRSAAAQRLTLLARDETGYRNLCKLLTAAARGRPKADARVDLAMVAEYAEGLHCLTGGIEGLVAERLRNPPKASQGDDQKDGPEAARETLAELNDIFSGRVHVELQRHHQRDEEHLNQALIDLARRAGLPLVATNGVRYAKAVDKQLHDILTSIRCYTTLDAAGRHLSAHRERHVRSASEMLRLFADIPAAVEESVALASQLNFTLQDLGYRFPDYPLPPGETAGSYLRQVTWNAARMRFRPFTARAQDQIAKELDVIEKLKLPGYFLIVWDIIRFCQRHGILAQGRGSAANSAVCYSLAITAVDPVKMDLLFERFLSEERGEWPDIDLDLPSGDQREKVIQYVYERYGPHGAGMTANVITYRDRLAAREVGKALGFSMEQVGKLSKALRRMRYGPPKEDTSRREEHKDTGTPEGAVREAGFDLGDHRIKLFLNLWRRMQNLPRHLGQHSGGMVIAAGRLDEVVPLEPASMPGRVVVQWDKDDCADLGIIKVDLLGLGMLNALEEAVPLIRRHEKVNVELSHLPQDDPKVYQMLRAADTVGVFQVESRAQMASLPRNAPEKFYDLVIQVAIIRPGPITGGMVHPFFERRQGRAPVEYLHPCLEPILKRTLGVPIFQEQILRIAMEAAGFTGGQAEELRRAMGFKRSVERMDQIEQRLRNGMTARGIGGDVQNQIVQSITSFALYGFPESHAASFALIAYASAYLKAYHPTAFYISLLNAWPMGFYHPSTLIQDAQRHGVEVRPVDVRYSSWRCTWEDRERQKRSDAPGAIRMGLRYVRGIRREAGRRLAAERDHRPFKSLEELAARCDLRGPELEQLAFSGAFRGLGGGRGGGEGDGEVGMDRREAMWQAARVARPAGPLFEDEPHVAPSPLTEMTELEKTLADYMTSGLSVGPHPMAYARAHLKEEGVLTTAELPRQPEGTQVRFAGAVIVRQRPGTAKGLLFVTLEDETGMAQAVIMPDLFQEYRRVLLSSTGLVIEGIVQQRDGSLSVKADKLWPIEKLAPTPSHDFH